MDNIQWHFLVPFKVIIFFDVMQSVQLWPKIIPYKALETTWDKTVRVSYQFTRRLHFLQRNATGCLIVQSGNEKYLDVTWMLWWRCWWGTGGHKSTPYQNLQSPVRGYPQSVGSKTPNIRQIEHWSLQMASGDLHPAPGSSGGAPIVMSKPPSAEAERFTTKREANLPRSCWFFVNDKLVTKSLAGEVRLIPAHCEKVSRQIDIWMSLTTLQRYCVVSDRVCDFLI